MRDLPVGVLRVHSKRVDDLEVRIRVTWLMFSHVCNVKALVCAVPEHDVKVGLSKPIVYRWVATVVPHIALQNSYLNVAI